MRYGSGQPTPPEPHAKTRLFAVILATAAGCGSKPAATTTPAPAPETASTAPAPTPAPAPAAPDPSRPKPEIGAWGFDLAGMDPSASPGESFYRYAGGKWLAATPIPADKAAYGMFTALADRSDERTRKIIESASGPSGSNGQRIADYYKTFMDEAAIEAKGLSPIQAELDKIARIKDANGLVLAFASASRRLGGRGGGGGTSPFRTVVSQDAREPDKY